MTDSQSYEDVVKDKTETQFAQFDDEQKGLIGKVQHALHVNPALVPLIILVTAIALFGMILGQRFFSAGTLTLILQQVQIVGVLAAAQTLVILTAGIDLSVGAMLVFTSVIMGQFSFRYGIPAEFTIVIGLAAGAFMGFCNGWMVSRLKLPPFIVTLGTWQIILAANFIYSRNETIRSQDIEQNAAALQFWGQIFRIGDARVTYGVIAFLVLVLIFTYILSSTAWGRHVYAVGDDPEAAELAGVDTKNTLLQVYTIAGLLCGIAAWVAIGRFGAISPGASTGVQGNIQSITAVVIGGISLFGGRGSIIGMFLGALIVGVFEMGLRMAGADAQWTFLLIGVLIIGAVTVDQWIRKVSA